MITETTAELDWEVQFILFYYINLILFNSNDLVLIIEKITDNMINFNYLPREQRQFISDFAKELLKSRRDPSYRPPPLHRSISNYLMEEISDLEF